LCHLIEFRTKLGLLNFKVLNNFNKNVDSLPPEGGRESTNKIKVIKRRCYGIFDENSLFRRIFLDTEGYARFLNRTGVAMV
jgi:hypothetical protein